MYNYGWGGLGGVDPSIMNQWNGMLDAYMGAGNVPGATATAQSTPRATAQTDDGGDVSSPWADIDWESFFNSIRFPTNVFSGIGDYTPSSNVNNTFEGWNPSVNWQDASSNTLVNAKMKAAENQGRNLGARAASDHVRQAGAGGQGRGDYLALTGAMQGYGNAADIGLGYETALTGLEERNRDRDMTLRQANYGVDQDRYQRELMARQMEIENRRLGLEDENRRMMNDMYARMGPLYNQMYAGMGNMFDNMYGMFDGFNIDDLFSGFGDMFGMNAGGSSGNLIR